jgi:membrane dipeptidase
MERTPIFDGHNYTLLKICLPVGGEGRTFFEPSNTGHIDLPRAREGCFGGLFVCWTPPDPESGWTEEAALTPTEDGYEVADVPPLDPVYARGTADELVKILFRIEERPSLKAG